MLSEQKEREMRALLENFSTEQLQQALRIVKLLCVASEVTAAPDMAHADRREAGTK